MFSSVRGFIVLGSFGRRFCRSFIDAEKRQDSDNFVHVAGSAQSGTGRMNTPSVRFGKRFLGYIEQLERCGPGLCSRWSMLDSKMHLVEADHDPDNPFDPDSADLRTIVTMPSGRKIVVPDFWFQDYRRWIRNPEAHGIDRIEVLDKIGPPEYPGSKTQTGKSPGRPRRAQMLDVPMSTVVDSFRQSADSRNSLGPCK